MSQTWLLYKIQCMDKLITDNEEKLQTLNPGEFLLEEMARLQTIIDEEKTNLRKKQTTLKDKELEVQKYVTQRKGFEKKLYSGDSSNTKELSGWQQEIDNLKKLQNNIEEEMLVLMEEIEKLEKDIKDQETSRSNLKEDHKKTEDGFNTKLKELSEEIDTLKNKKQTIIESIDPELMKTYMELADKRDGIAVGRIMKGICGGCFMNLPESTIKRVQQRDLEFCNHCGRILYIDGES